MKRNMTAGKPETDEQQPTDDMLVRLFTVAELLVSRDDDPQMNETRDDERAEQEAGRIILQKTQAMQVDV